MRSLASLLTATIVAVWIVAIALISVQNATPVALRFLNFQLIEIPFGLVLAFSAGIGVLGTAIAQPLLGFSNPPDDD
ncbi:LapA family protein [Phormidesmis sp. 146-35]